MNTINKNKGPVRPGAIIPLTLIMILIVLYFKFLFDFHLKSGLESAATRIYGAEVNVARVKTGFSVPSLSIHGIQVTDKKTPDHNLLEIKQIRLQLLWDALLRGKLVIPEASILQIKTGSKREQPGRILPPNKRKTKSPVTTAAEKTMKQLKEKNQSNLLSDIFSIAGGKHYKDQLKKLEDDFKTHEKIKTLEENLKLKKKEWEKHINRLSDESEIKQLVKNMESIKIDFNNPETIGESLKKIESLYGEIQTKHKTIENIKKTFRTDIEQYRSQYKELENLIQQDIDEVLKKLNIPSLDLNEINKMLLGNLVVSQLRSVMEYKDLVRKYMPNKISKKSEPTPTKRARGVDYFFPKKKSYPLFWLKKAQVSSQSKNQESGNLSGVLKNLTNNPGLLGLPTTFDLKGGFQKDGIKGVSFHVNIDHTTPVEKESGFIFVESFPVKKNLLVQSRDVVLGYGKAMGQSRIEFELKNQQLSLQSRSSFKNVNYFVKAKNKNLKRILDEILKELNSFDFNIQIKGSWEHFSLGINSNLAHKLLKATTSQVSNELTDIRKNVEKQIKNLMNKEKHELEKQVNQMEKQWESSFKRCKKTIQSAETRIQEKKDEILKKETGKKELNKLLQKIRF